MVILNKTVAQLSAEGINKVEDLANFEKSLIY